MWQCAIKLPDKQLLAKISTGDLIAQDDQNHVQLVSLYSRARENKRADDSNSDEVNHNIAFTELETYIEDACMDDPIAPVFKLNDLVSLSSTRMEHLGTYVEGHAHSTKLKDRLLGHFQGLYEI